MKYIINVRITSILDAISLVILVGFAMPMKYVWQNPFPVKIIGSLHGALFLLFCLALVLAFLNHKLSLKWIITLLVAAIIPILPFFLDHRLKKLQSKFSDKKE